MGLCNSKERKGGQWIEEETFQMEGDFPLGRKPEFEVSKDAKAMQLRQAYEEQMRMQKDGLLYSLEEDSDNLRQFPPPPLNSITMKELPVVTNEDMQSGWTTFAIVIPAYVSIRGMGCSILTGMRQYEDLEGNIITEFTGFKVYPLSPKMLDENVVNVAIPAFHQGKNLVTRLDMVISGYFPTKNAIMVICNGGIGRKLELDLAKKSQDPPVMIALAALKKDYPAETTMELSIINVDSTNYDYKLPYQSSPKKKKSLTHATGPKVGSFSSLRNTTLVNNPETDATFLAMSKRYASHDLGKGPIPKAGLYGMNDPAGQPTEDPPGEEEEEEEEEGGGENEEQLKQSKYIGCGFVSPSPYSGRLLGGNGEPRYRRS